MSQIVPVAFNYSIRSEVSVPSKPTSSKWFLLFIYYKDRGLLSPPILYEEECCEYRLAIRCKLLPEMLGLTDQISKVIEIISKEVIETEAKKFESNDPAFLFDFAGNLCVALPFEIKKIRL